MTASGTNCPFAALQRFRQLSEVTSDVPDARRNRQGLTRNCHRAASKIFVRRRVDRILELMLWCSSCLPGGSATAAAPNCDRSGSI